MDSERAGMSFEQIMRIWRKRAPWILVCLVVFAGAAYGYSKHKTKKYTATAALSFNNSQLSEQIAGISSLSSATSLLGQQNTYLESVKVGDMAAKTAILLGHGLTEEVVSASLTIKGEGESNIVEVAATSTSPALAAAIANTYTRQFVKEQQSANRQFFRSALALVNKQLRGLPPAQRFGTDGLDLQDRAHTLGLLAELGYNNAQVVQEAAIPSSQSSPKVSKDTILGAILGLLLGLGIALLLERFDRRIGGAEELESIYGLPLLGVVPKSTALLESALPPTEAEAFSMIRAHLRFFNVDREVRMVVIASPAPGDGKTTIARHLAEAAARLGSRVLLLEADLRQPTLALHLDTTSGPGLADVLIDVATIGEATQSVDVQAAYGEGTARHTLDVLTAGAVLPPNPGELLASRAMDAVLEQTRATYDLVVIDTPPLTAVSDAFPLLTKVDGVVIVGRVGYSRRDVAERLQHVLAGSGAPLLGVIANGSKSGLPSPYPGRGESSPAIRTELPPATPARR
jgi:capsular exopolysaccharide synthesis family protein